MRARVLCLVVVLCGLAVLGPARPASAALDAAQRKELAEVQKEITAVAALIRQKKYDEAEAALDAAEERIAKIKADAGVEDTDPSIRRVNGLLAKQRGALPVSFAEDVAPILEQNCLSCHGEDNPRRGLRLDTFAGMKRGGMGGVLLVPRNPQASLLYRRLVAGDNARMPKDGQPLADEEIQTIAAWIQQGASYDAEDENTPLADLGNPRAANSEPVDIPMATGDEKVSFTKDIAPFMVNLCLNCHSGNNPRGGLSLVSFQSMMEGGDSGRVIIPGNREGSRLFRLVGGLENPRMPQGQARITRKNYEDLITWFDEGNRFDGKDPKTPLRELVPTPEEIRAAELAKMTPEQWQELRKERAGEIWENAFPREEPKVVEAEGYLVYGNVPEARLKEVAAWADEFTGTLRETFNDQADPLFKGKLSIFVIGDRFGYEEFNQIIERRETPPEMSGHSVVSASQEEAYVALHDLGDTASATSPTLKLSLMDHLTGAYLQRGGGDLPDWVVRGTGLALAARADSRNEYVMGLRGQLAEALRGVQRPEDVFADGTFSPSQVGAVGYSLVEFLLRSGGAPKFGQFIQALQQGRTVAEAVQGVYRVDLRALGTSYAGSVR